MLSVNWSLHLNLFCFMKLLILPLIEENHMEMLESKILTCFKCVLMLFFSMKKEEYEVLVHNLVRSAVPLDHSKSPCVEGFIPDTRVCTLVVYTRPPI